GVGNVIGAGAVALQGVGPLRDAPGQRGCRYLPRGEVDLQSPAEKGSGTFAQSSRPFFRGHSADELVAEFASDRRDPLPGQGPGLHRLTIPTRGGAPGVLLLPVAPGGGRDGLFVPRVEGRQGSPLRVAGEAVALPVPVVGVIDELLNAQVQVGQARRAQLAV